MAAYEGVGPGDEVALPPMLVRFHQDFPEDLRDEVLDAIEYWAVMARQFYFLLVEWGELGDAAATVDMRPQYRVAVVAIDRSWRTLGDDEKSEIIRHELAHAMSSLISREMEGVISSFVPEVIAERENSKLVDLVEALTSDISNAVAWARQKGFEDGVSSLDAGREGDEEVGHCPCCLKEGHQGACPTEDGSDDAGGEE